MSVKNTPTTALSYDGARRPERRRSEGLRVFSGDGSPSPEDKPSQDNPRTPTFTASVCPHSGVLANVEIFKTEKEYRAKINEYRKQLKSMLITSRFTTDTLLENAVFRQRNPKVKCAYSSPTSITHKIPKDMTLYVLEMNNTTNKIVGIGMVRNSPICNKYKLYYNISYNRFAYLGTARINRENMTAEEEEIMKVFDAVCFKGASNMKRGQGLTAFPMEPLYRVSKTKDLVEFVKTMFRSRM